MPSKSVRTPALAPTEFRASSFSKVSRLVPIAQSCCLAHSIELPAMADRVRIPAKPAREHRQHDQQCPQRKPEAVPGPIRAHRRWVTHGRASTIASGKILRAHSMSRTSGTRTCAMPASPSNQRRCGRRLRRAVPIPGGEWTNNREIAWWNYSRLPARPARRVRPGRHRRGGQRTATGDREDRHPLRETLPGKSSPGGATPCACSHRARGQTLHLRHRATSGRVEPDGDREEALT